MQIVIEIPDKTVNEIKDNAMFAGTIPSEILWDVTSAIVNSTLLPEHHGRLVDADEVVKDICIEYKANSIYELSDELRSFIKKYLNEASTILKPTIKYMIKNYAFSESEDKE